MQTFASLFERKLDEFLMDEIENIKGQLASGVAVQNIEDFRRLTGMIAGLELARGLFDEARKAAEER